VKPAYPKKFALMFFDEFLRLLGVLDRRFSAGSIPNVSGDLRQVQQPTPERA
jgi:hypothetical protein